VLCGQLEKKFVKPLDKPHKLWYNISVVRKRTEASRMVQKKDKNPLDKSLNLCYNKYVR